MKSSPMGTRSCTLTQRTALRSERLVAPLVRCHPTARLARSAAPESHFVLTQVPALTNPPAASMVQAGTGTEAYLGVRSPHQHVGRRIAEHREGTPDGEAIALRAEVDEPIWSGRRGGKVPPTNAHCPSPTPYRAWPGASVRSPTWVPFLDGGRTMMQPLAVELTDMWRAECAVRQARPEAEAVSRRPAGPETERVVGEAMLGRDVLVRASNVRTCNKAASSVQPASSSSRSLEGRCSSEAILRCADRGPGIRAHPGARNVRVLLPEPVHAGSVRAGACPGNACTQSSAVWVFRNRSRARVWPSVLPGGMSNSCLSSAW